MRRRGAGGRVRSRARRAGARRPPLEAGGVQAWRGEGSAVEPSDPGRGLPGWGIGGGGWGRSPSVGRGEDVGGAAAAEAGEDSGGGGVSRERGALRRLPPGGKTKRDSPGDSPTPPQPGTGSRLHGPQPKVRVSVATSGGGQLVQVCPGCAGLGTAGLQPTEVILFCLPRCHPEWTWEAGGRPTFHTAFLILGKAPRTALARPGPGMQVLVRQKLRWEPTSLKVGRIQEGTFCLIFCPVGEVNCQPSWGAVRTILCTYQSFNNSDLRLGISSSLWNPRILMSSQNRR